MKCLTMKLPLIEGVFTEGITQGGRNGKQSNDVPTERRLFLVDLHGIARPITVYTTSDSVQFSELKKALMAMQYATASLANRRTEALVKEDKPCQRTPLEHPSKTNVVSYDWFYSTRKAKQTTSNQVER